MIEGITENVGTAEDESTSAQLATVGAVYNDGVSLIFDGQEAATQKHYKCNTAASFQAGDRVKVARISGSYIVEYPIGAPGASGGTSKLVNGNFEITLNEKGQLVPTGDISIGTSASPFARLYAGGFTSLSKDLVGFFGSTGTIQATALYKTISSSNQVAALQAVMNLLISLGFFK